MSMGFQKNYILLAWAGSENEENKNFGDELSWYIVNRLSKKRVIKADFISRKEMIFHFMKSICYLRFTRAHSYFLQFFIKNYLLSVGSILSFARCDGAIVWGSGIIGLNVDVMNFDFRAVRGPITRQRLLELGYHIPEVYGDPALLLPLIYNNSIKKQYKLGVVPHVVHEAFFGDLNENVSIISLKGSDIHAVIDNICSCDCIISTSLHGVIVAHAYGIPAIWLAIEEKKLLGDNIKFYDYFQSVNFCQQQPLIFNDSLINAINSGQHLIFFDDYNLQSLNNNIRQRQIDLINSAPFKIKINLF